MSFLLEENTDRVQFLDLEGYTSKKGTISVKSKIKPELVKIPIIKELINKYGVYEAENILAAISLLLNKEYLKALPKERRVEAILKEVKCNIDISNCSICNSIYAQFEPAFKDGYTQALDTMENLLGDATIALEDIRVRLGVRRAAINKLEFSSAVTDAEMEIKIEAALTKFEESFKFLASTSKTVFELLKNIKDIRSKASEGTEKKGTAADQLSNKFDN
jgi:transcriptional regulator with XRE-family HTH domain